jgi:STE24 endopeptidase
VDKSKDTEAINAYVTGMFGAKRIVLWDTILAKLNNNEIAFVMAHEMTHYVKQHIWKMIGIISLALLILLFVISRTIQLIINRFKKQIGFREVTDIASLPLLLLMFSVLMFLITPVFNMYSRQIEREADQFGLELTGDRESAVTAFVKLANENLSNPSPSPVIEFWLYDHPALKKRIDFCRNHPLPVEKIEEPAVQ